VEVFVAGYFSSTDESKSFEQLKTMIPYEYSLHRTTIREYGGGRGGAGRGGAVSGLREARRRASAPAATQSMVCEAATQSYLAVRGGLDGPAPSAAPAAPETAWTLAVLNGC
jgi:hypothetical protein